MYDKYKGFLIVQGLSFHFQARRYEVWQGGSLIANGNCNTRIEGTAKESTSQVVQTKLYEIPLSVSISQDIMFGISYTSSDRIYLATVPSKTNINNYPSFMTFKMSVPLGFNIITIEEKFFSVDEPYACSIFTINGVIDKITFSFGNNPRLLEFYA